MDCSDPWMDRISHCMNAAEAVDPDGVCGLCGQPRDWHLPLVSRTSAGG